MEKIVYAFDRETLEPVGTVELNDGDRCQITGAWLVPGDCLDVAPPTAPAGQRVVARHGVWHLEPIPEPPAPEALPVLDVEQPPVDLAALVQRYMDATARAHGYDSLASAISYADEMAVPKFGAEGRAFRAWRSKVWAKFFTLDTGLSIDDAMQLLPIFDIEAEKGWADSMQVAFDVQAAAAAKAEESATLAAEVASASTALAAAAAPSAEAAAAATPAKRIKKKG